MWDVLFDSVCTPLLDFEAKMAIRILTLFFTQNPAFMAHPVGITLRMSNEPAMPTGVGQPLLLFAPGEEVPCTQLNLH